MAEGTGLLNRRTGFSGTEGSNPSLSAILGHFGPIFRAIWIRSSMDRAPAYEAGGYRFEPCRIHDNE